MGKPKALQSMHARCRPMPSYGKAKSIQVYACKIEAYTEFIVCRDAQDVHLMKKCPTKSKYNALALPKPNK